MPRLWYGNFDFEHRLARPKWQLPAFVERINAELATSWLAVAEDGDYLWTPRPIDDAFFDEAVMHGLPRVVPVGNEHDVPAGVEFCPWGWTEPLRKWAARNGWRFTAPPQSVVRFANSRRFSAGLEHEWNVGLPSATPVESVDAGLEAIHRLPREAGWVIKAEFSMSARERILGSGEPNDEAIRWLMKRLRLDGVAFFEPRVERVAEAGIQIEIPFDASQPPRFLGLTPLLCDVTGAYRGSDFTPNPKEEASWAPAIATARRAAKRLQQMGYFGPLGIDAMQYRDADGETRLRPLQDVNARWTMGRLSLGWRRLLQPGESGVWLRMTTHERPQIEPAPKTRIIRTAPTEIDGEPLRHAAAVIISPLSTRQDSST